MGVLQVVFTNLCCTTIQIVLKVAFIMVAFRQWQETFWFLTFLIGKSTKQRFLEINSIFKLLFSASDQYTLMQYLANIKEILSNFFHVNKLL